MRTAGFFFATACTLACSPMMFAQADVKEAKIELTGPEQIDRATINGDLFFQLIRGKTDRFGESRLPYFYPIVGPTGAKMTRSYPIVDGVEGEAKDHPHHTSLWFAHGNVNGIDFWHDPKAKISVQHSSFSDRIDPDEETDEIWIVDKHHWIAPDGKTVLIDRFKYNTNTLDDGARFIDLSHQFTPGEGQKQVTFGDTKEGTMAIRTHPALRLKGKVATGKAINSEGVTGKAMWGKRAKWVAYWGVIDGKTCGVAIFDHPTNLRHPTWWHARDYGLVAANPFGISDFERKPKGTGDYTLKQGETLSLRYRFVFFAGTAEEAKIAEKYERWVKETASKKSEAQSE